MDCAADEELAELPNFRLAPALLQHGAFQRKRSHGQLPPPPPPKQLSLANAPFDSREPRHEMQPPQHGSQNTQLAKASQAQPAASSESPHGPSDAELQLSAAGSTHPPCLTAAAAKEVATKAVAEMTRAMQSRMMKVCNPKPKAKGKAKAKAKGKTSKDKVIKKPASSTTTSTSSKSLVSHEASRKQYLVRIAGQPSKAFSYKTGMSINAAKQEAEQYFARATKSK